MRLADRSFQLTTAPWFPSIPKEWAVSKLRYVLAQNDGGVWGEDGDEFDTPVLRSTEITVGGKWSVSDPAYRKLSPQERSQSRLIAGDLLVTKSSGSETHIGKTAMVDANVANLKPAFSNFMQRLRPRTNAHSRYLFFVLNNEIGREQFKFLSSTTTGLRNLNATVLNEIQLPLPPVYEQRRIATFLDHETARIDRLIAKQERLIELLKEKRQAVISHAVTKGLNPDAPMKDSGVEWLGEVPEHWEVVSSTWLFAESKLRARESDEQLSATQKYGVIRQCEFERLEDRQVTRAFMHLDKRKHVDIDNFVVSMRSFEGGIEHVKTEGCVRSSYVVLVAEEQADIGFFRHLFKSTAYIQGLQATSNYIRDGQDLNFGNFRQTQLPRPVLAEQREIAEFLDRQLLKIDALIGKALQSIPLLEERRSALISTAVTGKIDVRDWRPPEGEAEGGLKATKPA